MTNDWQPIETAPRDGTEVLIYADVATVPIVRLARWEPSDEFTRAEEWPAGWWSYASSVGQELLAWEPTHWAPFQAPGATGDDE